jgi:hypothetical protein
MIIAILILENNRPAGGTRRGPLRASEILAYDLERRIFSKKDLLPLLLQEIQSGFRLVD